MVERLFFYFVKFDRRLVTRVGNSTLVVAVRGGRQSVGHCDSGAVAPADSGSIGGAGLANTQH